MCLFSGASASVGLDEEVRQTVNYSSSPKRAIIVLSHTAHTLRVYLWAKNKNKTTTATNKQTIKQANIVRLNARKNSWCYWAFWKKKRETKSYFVVRIKCMFTSLTWVMYWETILKWTHYFCDKGKSPDSYLFGVMS